jgi:hypothetical protein
VLNKSRFSLLLTFFKKCKIKRIKPLEKLD